MCTHLHAHTHKLISQCAADIPHMIIKMKTSSKDKEGEIIEINLCVEKTTTTRCVG